MKHLQKIFNKINELRKVKSTTVATKNRKFIVNDAASKLFNEHMVKLDNEYIKLSNAEKISFALDTKLVIYNMMIMVIVVLFVTTRKWWKSTSNAAIRRRWKGRRDKNLKT